MKRSSPTYWMLPQVYLVAASLILTSCKDSGRTDVHLAKDPRGNGQQRVQEKYTSEQKTYFTDITKLPAYVANLGPIFIKLSSDAKTPWETLINLKKWLFIPQKLDATHSANMSAHLIGEDAETIATQKNDDIWMQRNLFKGLSETEQAQVLLQEIITSIYLLKNLSDEDLCKLIQASGKKTDKCTFEYSNEPTTQETKEEQAEEKSAESAVEIAANKETPRKPIRESKRLNEIDYHKIKVVALYIQEEGVKSITQRKLLKKMEDAGFDMRIFQAVIKN